MIGEIYTANGPQGWGSYELTNQGLRPSARDSGGYLIPGFVDLHIHGAFGIDFMSASAEDMRNLANQLRQQGYAGFLATTVTATASEVKAALDRLPDDPTILGVHLEGPFISPKYPGAQPESAISPIEGRDSQWSEILADTRIRQVTLAPELPGALELIDSLAPRMIVSGGHTDATFSDFEAAVRAGLSQATHTYNAMRPFQHREAGAVGAALLLDQVTAELIYDRVHVSRQAAELLLRTKPNERIVAVSDSTLASGIEPGEVREMWGHRVARDETRVRLVNGGALAGSCATLDDVFKNLAEDFGVETAVRLCCTNPRRQIQNVPIPEVWLVLDEGFIIQQVRTDLRLRAL